MLIVNLLVPFYAKCWSFIFIQVRSGPSTSSGWIQDFKLPTQFSLKTMQALRGDKKIDITNAVRCEIVSSISTLVMVHTISPTAEEKTILAQRLVAEYPILADNYGCGYVSIFLRISFIVLKLLKMVQAVV